MTLPKKDEFNAGLKSETNMNDGKLVTQISSTQGITDHARKKAFIVFGVALIAGLADFSCIVSARRFNFKIFETHIEGCSAFGFLSKNINLPIQQIGEHSYNELGFMPAMMIRTVHGKNAPIFMDADKGRKRQRC